MRSPLFLSLAAVAAGMQKVLEDVLRQAQLPCYQQVPAKTYVSVTSSKIVEEKELVDGIEEHWHWEDQTKTETAWEDYVVPGETLTDIEAEVRDAFAGGPRPSQIAGKDCWLSIRRIVGGVMCPTRSVSEKSP